jgi:hypothetical protein
LDQYLKEYYNLFNHEVFMLHGSQHFNFIKDIKQEYEQIIMQQAAQTSDTAKPEEGDE